MAPEKTTETEYIRLTGWVGWWFKITTTLVPIAIVAAAGLAIDLAHTITQMEARISFIEKTRFTPSDFEKGKREILMGIPPPQVEIALIELKADMRALRKDVVQLAISVESLKD